MKSKALNSRQIICVLMILCLLLWCMIPMQTAHAETRTMDGFCELCGQPVTLSYDDTDGCDSFVSAKYECLNPDCDNYDPEHNNIQAKEIQVPHIPTGDPLEYVAPTCIANGEVQYRCERCGEPFTETIPATGEHTPGPEAPRKEESTCTVQGGLYQRCAVCNEDYLIEELPLADHVQVGDITVRIEPTCGEKGNGFYLCAVCGVEISVTLEPTGLHVLNDAAWTTVTPAKIGVPGEETNKCTLCDTVVSREIPALPVYVPPTPDPDPEPEEPEEEPEVVPEDPETPDEEPVDEPTEEPAEDPQDEPTEEPADNNGSKPILVPQNNGSAANVAVDDTDSADEPTTPERPSTTRPSAPAASGTTTSGSGGDSFGGSLTAPAPGEDAGEELQDDTEEPAADTPEEDAAPEEDAETISGEGSGDEDGSLTAGIVDGNDGDNNTPSDKSGIPIPLAAGGIVVIIGAAFAALKIAAAKKGAEAAAAAALKAKSSAAAVGVAGTTAAAAAAGAHGRLRFGLPKFDDKNVLTYLRETEFTHDFINLMNERYFLSVEQVEVPEEDLVSKVQDAEPQLIIMDVTSAEELEEAEKRMADIKAEYEDAKFSLVVGASCAPALKARLDVLAEEEVIDKYIADDSSAENAMSHLILPMYKPELTIQNTVEYIGDIADVLGIPGVSLITSLFVNGSDIKEVFEKNEIELEDKAIVIADIADILGFETLANVMDLLEILGRGKHVAEAKLDMGGAPETAQ